MKRLFLLLAVSGIAVSNAQTVREENRGMIGKITATWCPPCGDWGWRLADQYSDQYKDDAFYMGIFASPRTDGGNIKFRDSTAYAWASMFGMSGFPSFSVNGADKSLQNTSQQGVNTAGITRDVATAMDAYKTSPLIAGTGYWYRLQGTEMTVQIKTKFFENVTGDYFVAAYLVEDGAMNVQAAKGSAPIPHHNVLRGTMSRGSNNGMKHWGEQIVSGSASAGDEFETTITLDLATQTLSQSQGWDMDKLKVVTIIWKKNVMGRYEYVNGNDKNEAPASVTDVVGDINQMSIYPNPASGNATLSVTMDRSTDVQIRIMDISGSVIYTEQTRFNSGVNTWNIETSNFASGTYLFSVATDKGTLTERLAIVK